MGMRAGCPHEGGWGCLGVEVLGVVEKGLEREKLLYRLQLSAGGWGAGVKLSGPLAPAGY